MRPGELNIQIEETLRGSFDLHVHAGPDPKSERRLDALDTARYAQEAEMAGFVLKSDYYCTAPLAQTLNRIYPGLTVSGSIVLNSEVGGLNPSAVEAASQLGARVVWMPTHSADIPLRNQDKGGGVQITDDAGGLVPKVHDVLDVVRQREMVLASGHVSPPEALALFRAAKSMGIQRLIATHPTGIATVEELREMIALGAYAEYPFLSCMPSATRTAPEEMVSTVRALGVEHCVVTTDFGQAVNPPPAEGFRMAIATLLEAGMGPEEVSTLVKGNPRQLMGLR